MQSEEFTVFTVQFISLLRCNDDIILQVGGCVSATARLDGVHPPTSRKLAARSRTATLRMTTSDCRSTWESQAPVS